MRLTIGLYKLGRDVIFHQRVDSFTSGFSHSQSLDLHVLPGRLLWGVDAVLPSLEEMHHIS